MAKQEKRKSRSRKIKTQEPLSSALREYFLTIVTCTLFALFVTTYVVHPMSVPTPSMEPTILVGDRVLVDKFTIRNGYTGSLPITPRYDVQRQDIIVCKSPLQPDIFLVKRVIGLPGDTFEIRDKTVYIGGNPLDEPYKQHSDSRVFPKEIADSLGRQLQRDNYAPIVIPEDSFIVMGDNRDDSLDSRYWGFLPRENMVGRPLFIFWSYEDPPDAHLKSSLPELVKLYGQRVIFFVTRTRWSRIGSLLR